MLNGLCMRFTNNKNINKMWEHTNVLFLLLVCSADKKKTFATSFIKSIKHHVCLVWGIQLKESFNAQGKIQPPLKQKLQGYNYERNNMLRSEDNVYRSIGQSEDWNHLHSIHLL